METVEQFNENFNAKKPKKKGLMIGLIVAALAIVVAFILVYFLVLTNPKFIFSKNIDKLLVVDTESYESVKIDTKIKADVDLEDTTYQAELAEVEKYTLKAGVQMDAKEKQEIVDLGLEYDNQTVVDAEVYYNDGEMYAYLEGLFDKYIELDMDEETKAQLNEMFESINSEKMKNAEKAVSIIREEIKTQIKENGEFDKKKDKIEVGKDEKKVTKSTVTISEEQLYKIAGNMFSNLAKNDEFLNCFDSESIEEYTGKSLKDILKKAADELKDIEGTSKNNVKISLYTKGFLNNNLVAVRIEMNSEDNDSVGVKIVKEDEGIYTYNIFSNLDGTKGDFLTGKVEIRKDKDSKKEQTGTAIITAEVVGLGSASLEIDYSVEYNKGIDKINTSNSINIEDLTENDIQSIMTKLIERPLIGELLEQQMNGSIFDTAQDAVDQTEETIGQETQNTLTTTQNEIKDYGYSVKYSVPEGFIYSDNASTDYMKFYDLENPDYSYIDATVTMYWNTETDYIEDDINWDYDYYLEDTEYYKNVNLSETKTIVVGDKTFKYKILSYESNYGYDSESKYQDIYIWYSIGDEYLFTVELEANDTEITEDIIKGFLNINVTELN